MKYGSTTIGNNRQNSDIYFANDTKENLASYLLGKANMWYSSLIEDRYLDKLKRSWNFYYGRFYSENHGVSFGGEQGELVNLAVNHYRNIARHIINMTTANRPSFQPRAVNSDFKSRVQAKLANSILNYYLRVNEIEDNLEAAVESAVVMARGYVKLDWNSNKGELYDSIEPEPQFEDVELSALKADDGSYYIDEEGRYAVDKYDEFGQPLFIAPLKNEDGELVDQDGKLLVPQQIFTGDIDVTNLTQFDVVFDPTKSNNQHDWVITRTYKNKFDLIALHPEHEDKILGLATKSDAAAQRIVLSAMDETVDIPVYEFYHRKTPAKPNGRYMLFLDDDLVLIDTPMPYRRLPVFSISAGEMIGTPYAYSTMFDLMGPQDMINSVYSAWATNLNAFAVQSILNPIGNDVKVSQVSGALNWIEYNPVGINGSTGKPEPLQLTKTPAEAINFIQMIKADMEVISGVNSVARGNIESVQSLRSGNALALVQSQAIQFNNNLQRSYIKLIEDVGTCVLEMLQDFATLERTIQIVGKKNSTKVVTFKNNDIDGIKNVIVDVGNSLTNTHSGKVQIAENLLQFGLVDAAQYLQVLETGNLDVMIQGPNSELENIQRENESLMDGELPIALFLDNHALHIQEHKYVLADPELRKNPDLVQRVTQHIQEHINLLVETDPNTLAMLGQQSLAPVGGAPLGPSSPPPAGGAPPNPAQSNSGLPKPAEPAQSPDGAPVNAVDVPLQS